MLYVAFEFRLFFFGSQNFMLSVAEAQLNAKLVDENGMPNSMGQNIERLDIFFASFFSVELLMNAFAHWFWSVPALMNCEGN